MKTRYIALAIIPVILSCSEKEKNAPETHSPLEKNIRDLEMFLKDNSQDNFMQKHSEYKEMPDNIKSMYWNLKNWTRDFLNSATNVVVGEMEWEHLKDY